MRPGSDTRQPHSMRNAMSADDYPSSRQGYGHSWCGIFSRVVYWVHLSRNALNAIAYHPPLDVKRFAACHASSGAPDAAQRGHFPDVRRPAQGSVRRCGSS
ncbi:protein of unknown function [Pseudomonas sp. JV551A1]|uniref:Uncharacterized protein n=1 Tax=Pseudomonas inefficax TaxID=2078786 RepID=A0AAQ1SVI7_9PSED|nr:protein of unknown function [Pseudomonas sp. JV551A1]SPO63153.1 protein of unknown function [Pseudomonas inefficax]